MGQKWFTVEEVASWPEGHKKCRSCQEVLPFSDFHRHKYAMFGYNTVCKKCRIETTRTNYYNQSMEQQLYDRAKSRATAKGRAFTIKREDIVIPSTCPILGIPISQRSGDGSPSLDRIDSSLGYIPGNVHVISTRANQLKNDATLEEIKRLYFWYLSVVSSE
jgi:hypothetical protein